MASQEVVKDQAFLIKSVDYGEGHRILSCLTAHHGRVSIMAYSAHQSRKRSLGVLDFLHCLQLEFKPHGPRGSLGQLVHCELKKSFEGIQETYQNSMMALSWIRLVSQILPEGGDLPGLFQMLYDSLDALESQDPFRVDVIFRRRFLSRLGYHLELSRCVRCSSSSSSYRFLPQAGGLLCENCGGVGEGLLIKESFSDPFWEIRPEGDGFHEAVYLQAKSILDESYRYFLGISVA